MNRGASGASPTTSVAMPPAEAPGFWHNPVLLPGIAAGVTCGVCQQLRGAREGQ